MFTWQKAGALKQGRYDHGAIFDGEKFLIIGGRRNWADDPINNEVCTLKGSNMTCVKQSTALVNIYIYPQLFLVPEDFGKDISKCGELLAAL